jgi:hypothetical protein
MRTIHVKNAIDDGLATYFYEILRDKIDWKNEIKSHRVNDTRKSRNAFEITNREALFTLNQILEICSPVIVKTLIKAIPSAQSVKLLGVYLNYYQNENDFTPNHKHDSQQIIISLGCPRDLQIGTKVYESGNGDITMFSTAIHGVPKSVKKCEGRISIALFAKIE